MRLVRLSDLEGLYGVPSGTARRWLSEGRLTKYVKNGKLRPWYVSTDEVEAIAQRHILAYETRRQTELAS